MDDRKNFSLTFPCKKQRKREFSLIVCICEIYAKRISKLIVRQYIIIRSLRGASYVLVSKTNDFIK